MEKVTEISLPQLSNMAEKMYGNMVKVVVDVKRELVVVDADLHVDEEQYLLEHGSRQSDLWGINLHPEKYGGDDFIEFDSMVNIRPRQNNRSRDVEDPAIRETIRRIINGTVHP